MKMEPHVGAAGLWTCTVSYNNRVHATITEESHTSPLRVRLPDLLACLDVFATLDVIGGCAERQLRRLPLAHARAKRRSEPQPT
jgi:hypothetical protein